MKWQPIILPILSWYQELRFFFLSSTLTLFLAPQGNRSPPLPPSPSLTSSMASLKIHPTTNSSPSILGPCPAHNFFTSSFSPDYFPTNINQAMHTLSLSSPDEHFYMDTSATFHMTHSQGNFLKYFPLKHHHNNHIIVGNGNMILV